MEIERLYATGKELGMSGAGLKHWVDAELARERDQPAQHREDVKAEAEQERLRREAEERVLKPKIELQEKIAGAQGASSGTATEHVVTRAAHQVFGPHKLMPPFNDARDGLDAYLQRFE